MRWSLAVFLVFAAGCELRGGLTHAQLHGAGLPDAEAPDAASAPDGSPSPMADAAARLPDGRLDSPPDATPPPPDVALPQLITITGTVNSNCGGVNANVGAGGRHTCSHHGKGGYVLRVTEVPGRTITISAQKEGYTPFAYSARIVLEATGTTHNIDLYYEGSCAAAAALPRCVCQPAAQCDPS